MKIIIVKTLVIIVWEKSIKMKLKMIKIISYMIQNFTQPQKMLLINYQTIMKLTQKENY